MIGEEARRRDGSTGLGYKATRNTPSSRDVYTLMPLLRRLTAVVCTLLLGHLTLLEGYGPCASHAGPQEHARVAAMQMTYAAHVVAPEPARDSDCHTAPMPSACSSMPSCATVLSLAVTAVAGTTPSLPASAMLPEPAAAHSRPAAAPDAPPPRG